MKNEKSRGNTHNKFFWCVLMSESMFEKTFWLKMKFRSIPPPKTIYWAPGAHIL